MNCISEPLPLNSCQDVRQSEVHCVGLHVNTLQPNVRSSHEDYLPKMPKSGWSLDVIMKLIDIYRDEEVLWDCKIASNSDLICDAANI